MKKRILSALLSACMLVSVLPVSAFAEEPTTEPTPVVEQTVQVEPTAEPTVEPTAVPTVVPTAEPTAEPVTEATAEPTAEPVTEATAEPTAEPVAEPTAEPSASPTATPTATPTPAVDEAVAAVQKLINALPTAAEVAAMDMDGKQAVADAIDAIDAAAAVLTAEQCAALDMTAYTAAYTALVADTEEPTLYAGNVAQVNGTDYTSLTDAIAAAAASDGSTLTLLNGVMDITISSGNFTLDLNGNRVMGRTETPAVTVAGGTITIADAKGGGLVIGGDGRESSESDESVAPPTLGASALVVENSAQVTITGGAFYPGCSGDMGGSYKIVPAVSTAGESKVTLQGGSYYDRNDAWCPLAPLFSGDIALANGYHFENESGSTVTTAIAQIDQTVTVVRDPVAAVTAADNTLIGKFGTLADALTAATTVDTATITLLQDVKTDAPIQIPKDKTVTLDLNDCTIDRGLTAPAYNAGGGSVIFNQGTLTIQDNGEDETKIGTITGGNDATFAGGIYNAGTLTIEGGKIAGNHSEICGGGICNDGILTIRGGIITGNTAGPVDANYDGAGIAHYSSGTLTIEGGTLQDDLLIKGGSVALNGGSFSKIVVLYYDPKTVGSLLGDGYGYKIGGSWATAEQLAATSIESESLTVEQAPVKITTKPTADSTLDFGSTVKLEVVTDPTEGVSYQWADNGTDITGATKASYTTDKNMAVGAHSFTCKVSKGGYYVASTAVPITYSYAEPTQDGGAYQIGSASNLMWFAATVNGTDGFTQNQSANAVLTADIDMAGITWAAMGSYAGTLDGAGFTISNLTGQNLIRTLASGGTVKNITFDNANVAVYENLGNGVIAGTSYGTISGCVVANSYLKYGNFYYCGGITGRNDGTIQNCAVLNSTLERMQGGRGQRPIGGITDSNSGTVKNCYTYNVTFTDASAAGGIVVSGNAPTNSYYTTGNVTSTVDGIAKSTAEFASGAVAWLLNGETAASPAWYQNLDSGTVDATPVLNNTHGTVYYSKTADQYTNTQADPSIDLSTLTGTFKLKTEENKTSYSTDGGASWVLYEGSVTLADGTTKAANQTVSVQSGTHAVILSNATLTGNSASACPFWLESGAAVNLTLVGTNSVTTDSTAHYPGIRVPADAALTITAESTGSINVTGGKYNAGIGSDSNSTAGSITINGGTVKANGGGGAAAIGGSLYSTGGTITITGGTVTAIGGRLGAGIGGGIQRDGGTVTITGGTVTATGGSYAAGIGGGQVGTGGTITITGGNVKATGNDGADAIGGGKGATGTGTLTDGNGHDVTLTTVTLDGVTTAQAVTALTVTGATYGIRDMAMLDTDKLYLYLPAGAAVTGAALADKTEYTGSVAAGTEGALNTAEHTIHIDTNNDGYCDTRGEIIDGIAAVAGYSLNIQGTIGVKFYMELGATALAEGATPEMHFTVNGKNTVVPLSEATIDTTTVTGKTLHVFTCRVGAEQMTDTVSGQIFVGDTQGKAFTETVKIYADYILSHQEENAEYTKMAPVVTSMLHYGGYTQLYANHNTENLANAGMDTATVAAVSATDVELFKASAVADSSFAHFAGTSLILYSETTLRYYFTLLGDTQISELAFNYERSGKTISLIPVKSGEYYYVMVENIPAEYLDETFTVTVTKGEDSMTVPYSAMANAYQALNLTSINSSWQNVMRAMFLYNKAANEYTA